MWSKLFLRLSMLPVLLMLGGAAAGLAEEKSNSLPSEATNSLGMEFVLIPAGSFTMGAGENDKDAFDDETPAHRVTISQPFYLGKYEA
ncbi:MAG: SUMF1/EgtB/PvdO family nonheme iron enzyme, partial [Candidatus Accumulibacter sp.]|nr:SUMF1/EgtB/PvdO family nonheme iron enzyme [Accumulibacter sp.]